MNSDTVLRIKAEVQGENNIRRLGGSLKGLQGQARSAAMSFSALKSAVAGFGTAIAGSAIVGGLGAIVKRSIDAGDELFNLQAKTGIAASALIGLGNAAKLADVDQATLGKSLTRLSVNLVKAAEGNDELARKFKALGVGVKDANGQVVPADKALKQIADRFADMPDGAQKAAAAVALFGRSGADLIPLLNEGAASMDRFTYKVGDDFAARSDLFNDTITTLGIQTQGFGLELTDALLPALQSILEVFGDLFDTKQDWTALFQVITGGLRVVATVVYATIKLVDQLIKAVVYSFDAIGKALQGDFSGAGRAISQGFGAGLEQAKRDFEQIGKIWTNAPSPGTGRRTTGREMDAAAPSAAGGGAAASSAAADARRAASEQEQLVERRSNLTQKAISLQEQLRNSLEDVRAETAGVGAGPVDSLLIDRSNALTENDRQIKGLTLSVVELKREVEAAGGALDVQPFAQLINGISDANSALADRRLTQGLTELLPPIEEYDAKIAEVKQGKAELTEVEKLNAQINLLQLDVLAATNPALAEHVRLLRERAGTLDVTTAKQEQLNAVNERNKQLAEGVAGTIGGGLSSAMDLLIDGTEEWGSSLKEIASGVLKDIARQLMQTMVIAPIVKGITKGFGFADGGIMSPSGPLPLKTYARGGIANSPQLALYGEGSMNEAYVPLPDGRRIPVALQGGRGGGSSTNVVVNVDASGNSKVSGDGGQAEQLGRVVSQAVQAELIRQKRPGGILA